MAKGNFFVVAVARDQTLGEIARLAKALGTNRGARLVVLAPEGNWRPNPALGECQVLNREES